MKKAILLLMTFILIFSLAACSANPVQTTTGATQVQSSTAVPVKSAASSTASTAVATKAAAASAAAAAENSKTHDSPADYVWDSASAIAIQLNGTSISASGSGVTVSGSRVTITAAGTYTFSGSLTDGQILVDSKGVGTVKLVLNGVNLHSSSSAPIYISSADKAVIILADNTQNVVSDAKTYVFAAANVDEPNAAIYSKADLSISGGGSLAVTGNYQDGITSKDGLIIASGTITVNAADDGIRGKDYLVVKNGNITVTSKGDGLKSDNELDATKGYVTIETGEFKITSGGDALAAQTDLLIKDGKFTITTAGGSSAKLDANTSAKGIKAVVNLTINSGTFAINAADDGLHTNGSLVINGGTFNIATGDDGMHADATLEINAGDVQVTRSYEGIESAVITINAGNIQILSSDDGINGAGGMDGSGTAITGANPAAGKGPGQDAFAGGGNNWLYINGGYIVVDAGGDGVDVNGSIKMTDGTLLVNGPTEQMNGALDYDASFTLSGGFVVAAGSSGMAMAPGQTSSQYSVLVYLTAAQKAGTLIHIQDSTGKEILTFAPTKQYQSVAFSSAALANGASYDVYVGGSSTGTAANGLYQPGTYSGGTKNATFTISAKVTTVGSGGRGPGGGTRPGRP